MILALSWPNIKYPTGVESWDDENEIKWITFSRLEKTIFYQHFHWKKQDGTSLTSSS